MRIVSVILALWVLFISIIPCIADCNDHVEHEGLSHENLSNKGIMDCKHKNNVCFNNARKGILN